MKRSVKKLSVIAIVSAMLTVAFADSTMSSNETGERGTVYVPAYSSIYHGDRQHEIKLTVTLGIRNTDMNHAITITGVYYYDTAGKLLLVYLKQPMQVKPLATASFLIKESENSGGPGAKFIVKWKSSVKVSKPLVETVMIGTRGQQGISFSSRGKEISE